jgi:hypothetical protein
MSRVRILAACHDPGATMAMRPVMSRLRRRTEVHLQILAGPYARPILDEEEFCWRELPTTLLAEQARGWLQSEAPQVLFTGTSWGANAEQQLRNEAAAFCVRSLVLLDYWSNYRSRWQDASYAIEDLADIVAVMDEETRTEMIEEGFPAEKLFVSGHPHVEELFASPPVGRKKIQSPRVLLFISLPLPGERLHVTPQQQVAAIAEMLGVVAARTGASQRLVVKLHPKEQLNGWPAVVQAAARPGVEVRLEDGRSRLHDLVAEADVVMGFISMALIFARAAGRQVIALDELKITRSLRCVYEKTGIRWCKPDPASVAAAWSAAPAAERVPKKLYPGAAQKVEELLLRLAAGNLR